jgi:hypothetical protein
MLNQVLPRVGNSLGFARVKGRLGFINKIQLIFGVLIEWILNDTISRRTLDYFHSKLARFGIGVLNFN